MRNQNIYHDENIKNLTISIKKCDLTPLFIDFQLNMIKLMGYNGLTQNDILDLWNLKTEFNDNNDEELVESFLKKVTK